MTKKPWTSEDQLIMKVRELLRSTEPRPKPINPHKNKWGVELVDCPVCHNNLREEVYNAHWTYYHGTKFWKEKALIDLLKTELAKT